MFLFSRSFKTSSKIKLIDKALVIVESLSVTHLSYLLMFQLWRSTCHQCHWSQSRVSQTCQHVYHKLCVCFCCVNKTQLRDQWPGDWLLPVPTPLSVSWSPVCSSVSSGGWYWQLTPGLDTDNTGKTLFRHSHCACACHLSSWHCHLSVKSLISMSMILTILLFSFHNVRMVSSLSQVLITQQ